jgi:hypothetical protein
VSQQRCYKLTEKIRLSVGRETDTSEMPRFEAAVEQPMCCPCDLEIAVGVYRGAIREFDGIDDALSFECLEMVLTQPRRAQDLSR